jgi:hypothetical protein
MHDPVQVMAGGIGRRHRPAASAGGIAVAWGRGVEAEDAPAYWPWRQVLHSLRVDADTRARW